MLLEGAPTILVKEGELIQKGMKSELMSKGEVLAALRLNEIEDIREVKLATLEVDGEVSVIKKIGLNQRKNAILPESP